MWEEPVISQSKDRFVPELCVDNFCRLRPIVCVCVCVSKVEESV